MSAQIVSEPVTARDRHDEEAPLHQIVAELIRGAGDRWTMAADPGDDPMWIHVRHAAAATPPQGWKLHLTASGATAVETLRRAAPALLAEPAAFKIAASRQRLNYLNEGDGGLSQIGKFITVYPNDDEQAVRLAASLDAATAGLRGPAIPSDRPLHPESLVYYRYGGFTGPVMQTLLGEVTPSLRTPDGTLVPDRRPLRYRAPEWADDPFLAAGVAHELPAPSPLIAGRYLIVSTINDSPRGAVHLGIDLAETRSCIIKQARRSGLVTDDGQDAHARLHHEAAMLDRLGGDERFPRRLDLVAHERDLYLIVNEFAGETIESSVRALYAHGRQVPDARVLEWVRQLASMLATLHAQGIIYRDLKTANVIVTDDDQLRLIDFDISQLAGTPRPPFGRGTIGYMSPQQLAGEPATPADDIYSLGALAYFLATGAEPSHSLTDRPLLARPLAWMNDTLDPRIAELITRCLDANPARRYRSARAVAAAAVRIATTPRQAMAPSGAPPKPEHVDRQRYADLARRLADTLCAVSRPAPGGRGAGWISTHDDPHGIWTRDINDGSAGAVLALAEALMVFDDPTHRAALVDGAAWLARSPRFAGPPVSGLYVGESGVAAALLRAGQALADPDLIDRAAERGRWIASLPFVSPDLFNGTAGRLRMHLLLWDETGQPDQLAAAMAAGEAILAAADRPAPDEAQWVMPAGYEGLTGQANLGYAHGIAGIADALLDLFEATGDERYCAMARDAARRLDRLAVPTMAGNAGLNWPVNEGDALSANFWCHGAAGIGRFFLHAARLAVLAGAGDTAERAARGIAFATRWANVTQCHGLAGNIEFLLDVYQATGNPEHLRGAGILARLLESWAMERDGLLIWPSENTRVISPDFMVGYAGVLPCLLRLADPAERPHLLSRQGFARHLRRSGGQTPVSAGQIGTVSPVARALSTARS